MAHADKKTDIIQSVDRALGILEVLELSSTPLGVTEISNRMNLHKSTAFGLLLTLERRGFVSQSTETGKYRLGLKLLELGEKVVSRIDLISMTHPFLTDLVERYKETVHLVIKNENEVVYIDKVDGPRAIGMYSKIGKRVPMHCTGVGKCLLAFMPQAEQEAFLKNMKFEKFTEHTLTNRDDLRKQLEQIRLQGYSVDDEEIENDLRCIAAPVYKHTGDVVAAISISGPSTRMTHEKIKELVDPLRACALSISKMMGYTGTAV
jgi:DNA-binding IclR family transcriptional regulator